MLNSFQHPCHSGKRSASRIRFWTSQNDVLRSRNKFGMTVGWFGMIKNMRPKKAFRFCPKCAAKLIPKKDNLLQCPNCSFHFYINPLPCNAVIIENQKGEILLVKRKFPPKKGFWDLPGGFIQPDEDLETSVKREIKEELGIDVAIEKIIGVYPDSYLYQNVNRPTLGIVVSAKLKGGKLQSSDDVSGFEFFPKKEVLNQRLAFPSLKRGLRRFLSPT